MKAAQFAGSVPGWMTELELDWLAQTASALSPGAVWLEVGTWMGRSWAAVAMSLPPECTIVSVDTFRGEDAEPLAYVAEHGPVLADFIRTHEDVRKRRPDLISQIICARSTDAARLVPDDSCDVIFIDGDHRTHMVEADLKAWLPKMKLEGLLCGHDISDYRVRVALQNYRHACDPDTRGSIWCLT